MSRRSTWTAGMVALAESMWAHGASASEISRGLGGISRSAVLGKLNRLGLLRTRSARVAINNVRRANQTAEARAQRSRAMKRRLADPVWRARWTKNIREGQRRYWAAQS